MDVSIQNRFRLIFAWNPEHFHFFEIPTQLTGRLSENAAVGHDAAHMEIYGYGEATKSHRSSHHSRNEVTTMSHVVKNLPWCVIDIDTTVGRVFFQQRWKYRWERKAAMSAWTLGEKRDFHNRADRQIWAAWSNRVRFKTNGSSPFARRFGARGVPVNLDIRWVTSNEHWNVSVWKIPTTDFQTSSVQWAARKIKLDTNDFNSRTHCTGAGAAAVCTKQIPVAHEFGHAAGNTFVLGRGDEYKASSTHLGDQGSILNAGSQLRDRHFQTIIDEMNSMIPDCTFSVLSVS